MNNSYEIKLPNRIYGNLVFSLFYIILGVWLLFSSNLFFLSLYIFVFAGGWFILTVYVMIRSARRTRYLEFDDGKLIVNGGELSVDQIDKIIIQGYFSQTIGIKKVGKRFVPTTLHFKFNSNDSEQAIDDIKQWASSNGATVTSGQIVAWL